MIYNEIEIITKFNTPIKCEDYLTKVIWFDGKKISPWGGSATNKKRRGGKNKFITYYCTMMRKEFNILKMTAMSSTHIPLETWFNILYDTKVEMKKGLLPKERDLERRYKLTTFTSYRIKKRIKDIIQTAWFDRLFEV